MEGDSPDREVCVFLPPSYTTARRRYPVVYLLHGFTDDTDNWWGVKPHFISVPEVANKALAAGESRELIIVMPDAFTRYQGSMYSNSATTGDWESFVAGELVAYIDAHYAPSRVRRAEAFPERHSMGGYGTIRIGMKHPEVFSSLYILSPCCMAPATQVTQLAQGREEDSNAKRTRARTRGLWDLPGRVGLGCGVVAQSP